MHSNSYTIFFTSIVTVVLGGFLSVAAGTLKETQELNVKNDSKKNILASLGFKPEGEGNMIIAVKRNTPIQNPLFLKAIN